MFIKSSAFCVFLLITASLLVEAHFQQAGAFDKADPQQVLAYQGDAVLTQAAIDGAFSRIPEKDRLMFIRDGAKVDQMVRGLLQAEVVALDAEKMTSAVTR